MLISTFFNFIIDISSCEDPSDFLLGLLELEEVIIGRRLHNLIVFKSFASWNRIKYYEAWFENRKYSNYCLSLSEIFLKVQIFTLFICSKADSILSFAFLM